MNCLDNNNVCCFLTCFICPVFSDPIIRKTLKWIVGIVSFFGIFTVIVGINVVVVNGGGSWSGGGVCVVGVCIVVCVVGFCFCF